MSSIVLSTLNAKYIHCSLGLRYLYANMGSLQEETCLREYTIHHQPLEIAEQLLALQPRVIGLSVYIWNVQETLAVVSLLKSLRPDIHIVLGGPEVSYEQENQPLVEWADYVICGAADFAFADLCRQLLGGQQPAQKIIHPLPVSLSDLHMPYHLYSDEDLAHRVMYVEASRGCPFKCEFCLSALDKTAKPFDLDTFLGEMQKLIDRGARHFKFVDRTFNLKIASSIRIMEFFLAQMDKGLFLHFELIPDQLPDMLKKTIARFPPGSLQFEVGIQSFNPQVQTLISRKQNNQKTQNNLRWLKQHSQAHLHTDLIFGLPGEDLASFAQGFNQLVALAPHEIQLGILKRLRGTPIIRHTREYQLRFNPLPPYNILSTDRIPFSDMQRINRMARYWDLLINSGRFQHSRRLILGDNPFEHFLKLSDWLYAQTGQTHRLALPRLFGLVYRGLTEVQGLPDEEVKACLLEDYDVSGLKGRPKFVEPLRPTQEPKAVSGSKRQHRHLTN